MARKIKDIAEEVKDLQGKVLSPSQLKRLEHEVHRAMVSSAEDIAFRRMALNNINMLKMAYLRRLMPTIDIINGNGVEYIPFAKSKLFDLKRLMTLTGQDFMYKNYRIGDTGILVRSGRDSIGDLIRIRQKGREAAYIFLIGVIIAEDWTPSPVMPGQRFPHAVLELGVKKGQFTLKKSNVDLSDYLHWMPFDVLPPLLLTFTNPSMDDHMCLLPILEFSPFYGSTFKVRYDGFFWGESYPAMGDYLPIGNKVRFDKNSFLNLCYTDLFPSYVLILDPILLTVIKPCSRQNIVIGVPDPDDPIVWTYCYCLSMTCVKRAFGFVSLDFLVTQKHSVITSLDDKGNNTVDRIYVYGAHLADEVSDNVYLFSYTNSGCNKDKIPVPFSEYIRNRSITEYSKPESHTTVSYTSWGCPDSINSVTTYPPEKKEESYTATSYSRVLGLLHDKLMYLKAKGHTRVWNDPQVVVSGTTTWTTPQHMTCNRYIPFERVGEYTWDTVKSTSANLVDDGINFITQWTGEICVGDMIIDTLEYKSERSDPSLRLVSWETQHSGFCPPVNIGELASQDIHCFYSLNTKTAITTTYPDKFTVEGKSYFKFQDVTFMDYDYLTYEDTFIIIYRVDTVTTEMSYTSTYNLWYLQTYVDWTVWPLSPPASESNVNTKYDTEYRIAYCIKGNLYPIVKIPKEYKRLYAIATHACKDNLLYTFLSFFDRRRVIGIINLRDDIKDMDVGYRQEFEINDSNWREFFEEETDPEMIKWLNKYYPVRKWFSKFPWKAPNAIGYHKGAPS